MKKRSALFHINRKNVLLILGLTLSALILLITIFSPLLETHNPTKMNLPNKLKAPSSENYFGTDALGRDVYSRILEGSRVSLGTAFVVVIFSAILGTAIGLFSGFIGGRTDMVCMRIVDIFLAFPTIVFVLAMTTFLPTNQLSLILAICCINWVRYARIARGEAVIIRNVEYIEAATAIGNSKTGILFRYFLPNTVSKILIMMSMDIGSIILYCASLSFLGLGTQPPSPAWGTMINEGRDYIRNAPWISIAPGIAVAVTALSFNMIGDGLRDALDPRMRESIQTE
jgi:peptide/nickel transport system permease protein